MVELKSCPFCGKNNIVICSSEDLGRFSGDFGYYAVCDAQNGGCGASSGWQITKVDAAEAWNKRYDNGN